MAMLRQLSAEDCRVKLSGVPNDNLRATAILDYDHPLLRELVSCLDSHSPTKLDFLRAAHHRVAALVKPVYSLDENQPVSVTLAKQRGSCSQRMACLEALARADGTPTRVRALWVKGTFWRRRFPFVYPFFPERVLLLWPEFFVEGQWMGFEELYGLLPDLAVSNPKPFLNDAETLFEAIETQAVDWFGKSTALQCECASTDLSAWVVGDDSYFATRDEALVRFGSLHYSIRGRIFQLVFGNRPSA
jgi:hypothetical protein